MVTQRVENWMKIVLSIAAVSSLFFMDSAFAASGSDAPSGSIGALAENVVESFSSLAKLITAGAYVAGMGFVLGAIFKFKAHKDNPTQIPIGTPIALLFIGAAMLFLPNVMTTAGTTVFTSSGEVGSVSGTDSFGTFSAGS